ncbi:hypothetical protein GCM10008969_35040 [Pseudomonas veronii subsp. inensis]|jgi:hypothetical protein
MVFGQQNRGAGIISAFYAAIGGIPSVTSPVSGACIMAKGMDSKKAAKKKPAKTADEKRADKKAKKSETGLFGH